MKKQIKAGMTLKAIEELIAEEIDGMELWGDIDFSEEEYEVLKNRIKDILSNKQFTYSDICRNFPKSITTFMVFMSRYKYKYNFWGLTASELEIELNNSLATEIGDCVRRTFSRCGFDYSEVQNERRKNVEPILFEAGIPPESCLNDLFYILSYDSHSVFDPQLIIDDMLDLRSYQIRKPVRKFLKRFQDTRAVEFVLDVHDAMLSVDQNREGDSRYIEIYSEWKSQEKTSAAIADRKKQEFQAKPYLFFDEGKKGLCMMMPHVLIADEWIDNVEWYIESSNGNTFTKQMNVFGDEGRRYIQPIDIAVCPATEYRITLIDKDITDDDRIFEWSIAGIGFGRALFFNATGRVITPNYLQLPYGIIIYSDALVIAEKNNIAFSFQAYPTNTEGYGIASIEPLGKDAEFVFINEGERKSLRVRPQVKMEFDGHRLFGYDSEESDTLFTTIPELKIDVSDFSYVEGLNVRIGKESIDVSELIDDGEIILSLDEYSEDIFKGYGTYSIKLYQNDHFIRQSEFSLLPDIKTTYRSNMNWPNRQNKSEKLFEFETSEEWDIEFESGVVSREEDKYIVRCGADIGELSGKIFISTDNSSFECGFRLPIEPFFVEIISADGEVESPAIDKAVRLLMSDFDAKEYWFRITTFGEYKEYSYKLSLVTDNGIEQEETIKLSHNGSGNLNLSAFYDTLRNRPLPAAFRLSCAEQDDKALNIICVPDTVMFSRRPIYQNPKTSGKAYISMATEDGENNLTVTRFGMSNFETYIPFENAIHGKSGLNIGYPIEGGLESGLYIISTGIGDSNIFMEEEADAELTSENNVMIASSRKNRDAINCFSDWLDQLIRDIFSGNKDVSLEKLPAMAMLGRLNEFEGEKISILDCEFLVALAFLATAKYSNDKKDAIRKCMREVSGHVLDRKSRLDLICVMANIKCSQEVFNICMDEYSLMIFEPDKNNSIEVAPKIINKSPELSMLLMMRADAPIRDIITRDKYRDILGSDAIKSMLNVPEVTEPSEIAYEQKRFLREEKGNKVTVEISSEISGDMRPIQNMIEFDNRKVFFNKEKKPDFGLYFDHIKYVDQYVNWYSMNQDTDGDIRPEIKRMMMGTVKNYCADIVNNVHKIETNISDMEMRRIFRRYNKALRERMQYEDIFANMNSNNHGRYFYLQGMAALLACIPDATGKFNEAVKLGERFMIEAMQIAPRIARRDIIMATTFIYLVRKEL